MFRIPLLSLLLSAVFATSFAQEQVADKIVAIVGKKIILESDVNQQFKSLKENNPGTPDTAKCGIIYELIAQQILIGQAERDSVIVSDEEVEGILDNRIRFWMNQAGSKERLEASSGRTVYQLKEDFRDFFKDKAIAERMQAQVMQNVKITPNEVAAFYNEIPKDSLPPIPASIEMGQIVIKPDVDPLIEELAKEKLEGIRKDILEGGRSFATMAGIYSMDGTKDDGGLLQINRTDFDPQFVAAAYRLQPGEISPVIKSKFGYHLIRMEKRMGEEAIVRHIVVVPEVTSIDLDRSMKKLDSIRADLLSGKITFSEAVGKYSTDEQAKMTGGMILDQQGNSTLQIDDLQEPALATAVSTLKVGEYSQPQIFVDPITNSRACRILFLKSRTDPHVLNLDDDYNMIRQIALQQKQNDYLHKWLSDRVSAYYIKVEPEYRNCGMIKNWNIETAGK